MERPRGITRGNEWMEYERVGFYKGVCGQIPDSLR